MFDTVCTYTFKPGAHQPKASVQMCYTLKNIVDVQCGTSQLSKISSIVLWCHNLILTWSAVTVVLQMEDKAM